MNKRLHLYCSGSVQGIGFRYTAERLAEDLTLAGWVRNLKDGRVEVIVEGKENALGEFLSKIEDIFSGYIRNIDKSLSEATGEFEGFEVRFD